MLPKKARFAVVIGKDEDGYFAYCPQLEGCFSQGEIYEEALKKYRGRNTPLRGRLG